MKVKQSKYIKIKDYANNLDKDMIPKNKKFYKLVILVS